ncbi:DNA cytosine methyltransferase [Lacrimispora indolis]|uniref:DNA cytosine methyltransferase n=1 Tax=Lacrimispora indolis TaxID=69825 RepID=UPI00045E5EC4|nr:DNA cytosine methyltransferase [Lacrimispora indolis]
MKDVIIDYFCGGGGVSVGGQMAWGRSFDFAINHSPSAISMHKYNHPYTHHFPEDIMRVKIGKFLSWGQRVSFVWASPDCTSHSNAKGDKPIERGLRILPMGVWKQCKLILKATGKVPEVIMMENVKEIQKWGPLDKNGKPIKARESEYYNKFIRLMKAFGYEFECRVLNSADYGAHTARVRWYGQFRCDGRPIVWPEQTHSKGGVNGLKPWEPISQDIDFTDLGNPIFTRKRPLKDKTLSRIAAGIKKFVIDDQNRFILPDKVAAPFLIQYHSETVKGEVRGQSLKEPIQTIDTANRYALVTCFLSKFYKTGTGQTINEPIHTITTSPGHFALVSAFLIKYYSGDIGQSLNEPIHTIVTKDRFGLVLVVIDGVTYQIIDIWFRMLKPEELKLGQGFPKDYIIDFKMPNGKPYPKTMQVEKIGNSVVPLMAEKLCYTACPYLKVGERMPNMRIDDSQEQLRFA